MLLTGLGLALFLTSSAFGLKEIVVVGSSHLSSTEVVRLCDVTLGTNILKVPTVRIKERLLADPRVAEATVSRKFPGSLVVRVVEREGVVLLPAQGQYAELDSSGLPLRFHRYIGALGLPVVTGPAVQGITLGAKVSGEGLDAALLCATALGSNGRGRVSEIHVDETGTLTLYTRDGVPAYFGPATGLDAKVEAFLGILGDLTRNDLKVSYIDVRYPRYPVVGSVQGPARPDDWVDPDIIATTGEP